MRAEVASSRAALARASPASSRRAALSASRKATFSAAAKFPNATFSAVPSWPIVVCASFEALTSAPSEGDNALSMASGMASIFFSSAVILSSQRPMSPNISSVRASLVVRGDFAASIECPLFEQSREYRIEVSIHAARQCLEAVHITPSVLFFRAGFGVTFKQRLVIRFIFQQRFDGQFFNAERIE